MLTFINVYNEFFFSFLMSDGAMPKNSGAPRSKLGASSRVSRATSLPHLYNLMAAASIVGVLPVAILVVVAQEQIVSGLTSGALKE